MKSKYYNPSTPRAALGAAAVAGAAFVLGLLVVAPASVRSTDVDAYGIGAQAAALPTGNAYGTEVTISPARIEVLAKRDGAPATGMARAGRDTGKHAS